MPYNLNLLLTSFPKETGLRSARHVEDKQASRLGRRTTNPQAAAIPTRVRPSFIFVICASPEVGERLRKEGEHPGALQRRARAAVETRQGPQSARSRGAKCPRAAPRARAAAANGAARSGSRGSATRLGGARGRAQGRPRRRAGPSGQPRAGLSALCSLCCGSAGRAWGTVKVCSAGLPRESLQGNGASSLLLAGGAARICGRSAWRHFCDETPGAGRTHGQAVTFSGLRALGMSQARVRPVWWNGAGWKSMPV